MTSLMVAPGATLPARVTSSVASLWSLSVVASSGGVVCGGPGSMPSGGMMTRGSDTLRPARVWNISMSCMYTLERPMMAIDCPAPVNPLEYAGLTL